MLKQLARRPGRTIAGLATVLAALGVAVGSGATFNAQTANPSNTFTSGTLSHTNSKNGVEIATGSNLKPGDVRTGETIITNTGSLAGTFQLSETPHSSSFAAGALRLKIVEVNGAATRVIYDGDFAAMNTPVDLGSFAPNEARTYQYTVTLVGTADNSQQGKTATARYEWDEVQS
jgi:spore coat-associated protein N